MSLKSQYPMYLNGTQIPWPIGWDMEYENIQNVNQNEAGGDIVDTVRYHKLTVGAKFKCSSTWASFFENLLGEPDFKLKFYHELDEQYVEITVRMTGFKRKLVKHSEKVNETLGVWEVTFDLVQF